MSKKKGRRYRVKGYERKQRPKGRKFRLDPHPILTKQYLVRDKYGHIIDTTAHPIKYKQKYEGRLL